MKKGDRIRATKTDVFYGFRAGDTLKVTFIGAAGTVAARNVTDADAHFPAILNADEYEVIID